LAIRLVIEGRIPKMEKFRHRINSGAAAVTVALGLLATPIAAGTASAQDEAYNFSGIERCVNFMNYCMTLEAYSSYSQTQIWINGSVGCHPSGAPSKDVDVTWCGVGGGNGTFTLNIGVNWYWWPLSGNLLWERMNISADYDGCSTWGYNSNLSYGSSWYNAWLTCEEFLHWD
jgi:hypothetical protein